ncbi:MAG: hypothetical protein RL094_450 [Candidatus Parcubacteria bacterium]
MKKNIASIAILLIACVGIFFIIKSVYVSKAEPTPPDIPFTDTQGRTVMTPSGRSAVLTISPCESTSIQACFGSGMTFMASSTGVDIYSLVSTESLTRYGAALSDTSSTANTPDSSDPQRLFEVTFDTKDQPATGDDILFFNKLVSNLFTRT